MNAFSWDPSKWRKTTSQKHTKELVDRLSSYYSPAWAVARAGEKYYETYSSTAVTKQIVIKVIVLKLKLIAMNSEPVWPKKQVY